MEAPKMNTRKLIGNNGVGKDQKHSQSQEIYNWLPLQLALLPQFASDTNYYQTLVYNWNEWIHFHSNQTFESPLFKYSSMLNEKSVRWLVLSVQTTVQSWWCARSNHDNLFYWNHDPLHFWIRQESSLSVVSTFEPLSFLHWNWLTGILYTDRRGEGKRGKDLSSCKKMLPNKEWKLSCSD